jgi:putative selenate reductase
MLADPRYSAARNATPPKKLGTRLTLFDCMTCDKCIPVCPNDANFVLAIPKARVTMERLVRKGAGWATEPTGTIVLDKPWQIGVFADACNECGNCDVFCPEDGAPYLSKPLFFGSIAAWADAPERDGFAFESIGEGLRLHGRLNGRAVTVERNGDRLRYCGEGFDLQLDPADPAGTAKGRSDGPVDLTPLRILEIIRTAITAPDAVNFVSTAIAEHVTNHD